MAKKIAELKAGDTIYLLINDETRYESYRVPALYECKVTRDACKQGSLDFPRYCMIYHEDPRFAKEMSTSLAGDESYSYNGGSYFADKREAYERYQKALINVEKCLKERIENDQADLDKARDKYKELMMKYF